MMTDDGHETTRSDDVYRLYRWITPLLIFALGSIVVWIGSGLVNQNVEQAHALARIQVQLARMQEQQDFAQSATLSLQTQINQILNTQATHEHRITVLEDTRGERRSGG